MLLLVQVSNTFHTIQTPISNVRCTKEYHNSELISRLNISHQTSSMKRKLPNFPELPLQATRMVTKLKKICSSIASGEFFTLTVSFKLSSNQSFTLICTF